MVGVNVGANTVESVRIEMRITAEMVMHLQAVMALFRLLKLSMGKVLYVKTEGNSVRGEVCEHTHKR
jgi:hypothetical protein